MIANIIGGLTSCLGGGCKKSGQCGGLKKLLEDLLSGLGGCSGGGCSGGGCPASKGCGAASAVSSASSRANGLL